MNEMNVIRALLDEAPPTPEVIAEGRLRMAAGTIRPRVPRPRWTLSVAGLTAAALAAVVTVVAIGAPPGAHPAGPSAGGGSFGPATTVQDVLRNAALAALRAPTGAPAPDSFVYTKLYISCEGAGCYYYDGEKHISVTQTWSSVDGTRLGVGYMGSRPNDRAALPACRDGFWLEKPVGKPAKLSKLRCQAATNAAYVPTMPTSPSALRSWIHRHFGVGPGEPGIQLTNVEWLLTTHDLTPAQRAGLYRMLAQTPGLTLVPHVTNVLGQSGVGIRSGVTKSAIYTIIFSRTTYEPLGMNWTGVAWPMKGSHNGEVLLKTAIVSKTPPLP